MDDRDLTAVAMPPKASSIVSLNFDFGSKATSSVFSVTVSPAGILWTRTATRSISATICGNSDFEVQNESDRPHRSGVSS